MSRRGLVRAAVALLLVVALPVALVAWLSSRGEAPIPADARPSSGNAEQVARGAVLARAGNCMACHTARGGAPYAGGLALHTPFGTVVSSNLTPDDATGLGRWSADHFWRALRHGRSADGRLLYPAFPFPEIGRLTRADSDALYAFLRTLPPVLQANAPHALRWPYSTQAALAVWRALFFRPQEIEPDASRSAEWNRGAYLVRGVAHCSACHGGRNALGATPGGGASLAGGLIPSLNWYAPALDAPEEASVADWSVDEIVALLRDGRMQRGTARYASVLGPMAEVVQHGTQHLPEADLRAMAVYLRALPQRPPAPRPAAAVDTERRELGRVLYGTHCADCHGAGGEGAITPDGRFAYPPLAGNRMVTQEPPANLVRAIAVGGYAPATDGHPRPFGMPPFAAVLSDAEIAAVATYLRTSWGAQASELTSPVVQRYRGGGTP